MGGYLSEPIKDKNPRDDANERVKYGSCEMQGWRNTMEDSHIALLDFAPGISLFGVFDGHGGNAVALYARAHYPYILKNTTAFKAGDYKQSLIDSFLEFDESLKTEKGLKNLEKIFKANPLKGAEALTPEQMADQIGCTACVALLTKTEIYVANAGDSRCVLAKKGAAFNMSEDHKPTLEGEQRRIEKAGGTVSWDRVNGILSLSRSMGDFDFKKNDLLKPEEQMVIVLPDVKVEKITPNHDFLILACDGIWDCMTSKVAVDFVYEKMKTTAFMKDKSYKISKIIESMMDQNISAKASTENGVGSDNMTCIIVYFTK